ncbi:hypothetical protein FACS1894160_0960 [Bacteroidia bacterium]|nr:hypothetical protein FACS1894160_0960 [Bacteroidia bacterium]
MNKNIFIFLLLCVPSVTAAQLTLENDSLRQFHQEKAIELSEVTVTGRTKSIDSRGLGNMRINMDLVRQTPLFLGERDVLKTLQFLPGVSPGQEGSLPQGILL